MNVEISGLDYRARQSEVTTAVAKVLHSPPFAPPGKVELDSEHFNQGGRTRLINFSVKLNPSPIRGCNNDGTGLLTLPSSQIARKFIERTRVHGFKCMGRRIVFRLSAHYPDRTILEIVKKMPFQDPKIAETREHMEISLASRRIRVSKVQFGVAYIRTKPETFSVEWDRHFLDHGSAFLVMEWAQKLIRVRLSHEQNSVLEHSIVMRFSDIRQMTTGVEIGNAYILFDLFSPPSFELEDIYRTRTGNHNIDGRKFRERVGYLDHAHRAVAPYAPQLRIVVYEAESLDVFREMCKEAKLSVTRNETVFAEARGLYSPRALKRVKTWLQNYSWKVSFQIEALLRNGIMHTEELTSILPIVDRLHRDHGPDITVEILRQYRSRVRTGHGKPRASIHALFVELSKQEIPRLTRYSSHRTHNCHHVTVTPTRLLLEGPIPEKSYRVIRRYGPEYQDNFLRVDFRDEDRLVYRWDRAIDGESFLQGHVGGVLREGLELAGRHFDFLAYSSSALRGHAVWFVAPFEHPDRGYVDAAKIREHLGDFSGVSACPAKYAARMAQAFTATYPSVSIPRTNWTIVDDIVHPKTRAVFTDGCGTISTELRDAISAKTRPQPDGKPKAQVLQSSAYQIRFLGFKGMVSVDPLLSGTHMRLRPSMNKFQAHEAPLAEIEIVNDFLRPGRMHLNRSYIMILEDCGVPRSVFMKLQDNAVKHVREAASDLGAFSSLLYSHRLGQTFHLSKITARLANLGLNLENCKPELKITSPFLLRVVDYSATHVLREIKHRARIPVPGSWQLVGVVDEGADWKRRGLRNVRTLAPREIYACIQEPGKDPLWLEGKCLISRSPTVHPGDVQTVHAIGKPPSEMACAFSNLVNCVVFSTEGNRPLPSCLAGGDTDGDLFDLCMYSEMKPKVSPKPGTYAPVEPEILPGGRKSDIEDVIDFVVDFIYSDILGLLATDHLIIADQSKEGVFDSSCLKLAELCSQAVDYPKSGRKVDRRQAPRKLIPYKPDWQAGEVINPRAMDYYRSERAVGYMYRAISLDNIVRDAPSPSPGVPPPLSTAIRPIVQTYVSVDIDPTAFPSYITGLFQRYHDELQIISVTHTLTNDPSVRLKEEEIVVGTIMAKCSQHRLRKDRLERLKTHAETLIANVENELTQGNDGRAETEEAKEDMCAALRRVWEAWMFAAYHSKIFGANSFGLIALSLIFDISDGLRRLEEPASICM